MHSSYISLHYKTIDRLSVLDSKAAKLSIIELLNQLIEQKVIVVHAWCLTDTQLDILASFPANSNLKIFENHFIHPSANQILAILKEQIDPRLDWILEHFKAASTQLKSIYPFLLWETSAEKRSISDQNKHELYNTLNQIHQIPIEYGWVNDPCHYVFSSCYAYAGGVGLIDIRLLHLGE